VVLDRVLGQAHAPGQPAGVGAGGQVPQQLGLPLGQPSTSDATGRPDQEDAVPTLHIEHPITDLDTWLAAFDRFADRRTAAGVTGQRIWQPAGDRHYVVLDLAFGTAEQAASFLHFLQTQVWTSPGNAPALTGAPRTSILDPVRRPSAG
jgi:hypothetical protein